MSIPQLSTDEDVPLGEIASEQPLVGALVRGVHCDLVRAALPNPKACHRRDHQIIVEDAYRLLDRDVTPEAPLIHASVGHLLDSVPYLYALADYAIGLTPDRIREHGRRVAAFHALRRLDQGWMRAKARILEHPASVFNGAVSDLAAEIDAIQRQAEPEQRSESLPELLARLATAPAREMVFDELLALGEIGLIHGQPRDGKTWVALEIAIALALQESPFRMGRLRAPRARRTLIVSNEDGPAAYAHRLQLLCAGRAVLPPDGIHLLVGCGVWLDDPASQRRVANTVIDQGIELVILDPARSLTGCVDKGPSDLQPFSRYLRRLVGDTGVAVLVIHHDTKPMAGVTDTRRRAQRSSGGGLFSIADAPMHLERLDENRSLLTPDGFKHRSDPEPFVVHRQITDDWARLTGESTAGASADDVALHALVLDYLRNSGGGSGRGIATAVRRRRDDVNRALEQLLQAGAVDMAEGPKRSKLWCIR